MLPDRVSNPGPLTYESGALPIALRGPAQFVVTGKIYAGSGDIIQLEHAVSVCTVEQRLAYARGLSSVQAYKLYSTPDLAPKL